MLSKTGIAGRERELGLDHRVPHRRARPPRASLQHRLGEPAARMRASAHRIDSPWSTAALAATTSEMARTLARRFHMRRGNGDADAPVRAAAYSMLSKPEREAPGGEHAARDADGAMPKPLSAEALRLRPAAHPHREAQDARAWGSAP